MLANGGDLEIALLRDLVLVARSLELAARDRGATPAQLAPLRTAGKRLREALDLALHARPGEGESEARRRRAVADDAIGRLGAVLNAARAEGAPRDAVSISVRERAARWAEARSDAKTRAA